MLDLNLCRLNESIAGANSLITCLNFIADLLLITGLNVDLGSKTHHHSWVLIEGNPLFFSAKLYDTYFGNAKEGSHPPPPLVPSMMTKWQVPARVKRHHSKELHILRNLKWFESAIIQGRFVFFILNPAYICYTFYTGIHVGIAWVAFQKPTPQSPPPGIK